MGHIWCTPKKPPMGEAGFEALKGMLSPIILFLGKPRTGKDIMIRCMFARYKLRHINVLNIIKDHVKDGTPTGHLLEDLTFRDGSLIPRIVILEMIKQHMCKYLFQSSGFILDGYPRDLQECMDFEKYIAPIAFVMYLELPPALAMKRIRNPRKLHGHGYPNFQTDTMAWRLAKFDIRTSLMLEFYKEITLTLDGKKKTMVVYVDVMDAIDELFYKLGIQTPSRFV